LGITVQVLDIPSCAQQYGSLATEDKEFTAPVLSLPLKGLAPGANGCPDFLPSGVEPVNFPYTTFEVIVSIDIVILDFLYGLFFSNIL
jgi:hypothetical protein